MSCLREKWTLSCIVWSFVCLWISGAVGTSHAQTRPFNRATLPPNNVPVAVDDTIAATPFGQAIDAMVLTNDHDGDGGIDPITINSFDTTSVNGGTITQNSGVLRYTPAANFSGSDSFSYTISDGFSVSNAATVAVRVNALPVPSNDTGFTAPVTQVSISVLSNDNDGDSGIDTVTINGFDATSANGGTVTQSGAALAYTPAIGFTGTDTFTYTISDGIDVGGPATVTVTVVDGPAANHDQATTAINMPVTINALANDVAGSGATLDAASLDLDPSQGGTQSSMTQTGTGTFTSDGNGNVTFAPDAGFAGTVSVSYTINDNFGMSSNAATITIEVVNTPPVATDDQATGAVNTPITINVLANDSDADGHALSIDQVSTPAHGTVVVNAGGTITYTPAANFSGSDSFTYTISDVLGGTASATVTLNIGSNFVPPMGHLTASLANLPEIEWRMVWINGGNAKANAIRVAVDIPAVTTFVVGSLTCQPTGTSTVDLCSAAPLGEADVALGAIGTQILFQGTLGADASANTEATAANEVVITYRVTAELGFAGTLQAQAEAHWDENGDGNIDDEVANAQSPALSDDPATPEPNDPTVVVIPVTDGACLFQMRPARVEQAEDDSNMSAENDEDQADGVTQGVVTNTRATDSPLALTTPQSGQVVAGTSVAVAALQGPSEGTTTSASVPVTVANVTTQIVPDIVETSGAKMELIPATQDHVVVTAGGVLVSVPSTALAAEDTLEITEVALGSAPGPLPGEGLAHVYNIALTSGQSQFASPISLRIPYDDADQNGIVDGMALVLETELTLWRYDAAQGIWVQLPQAVVIPDVNATIVQTEQGGLIGLFRAADSQAGTLGTIVDDVIIPASGGHVNDVETVSSASWETVGLAAISPFVTSWNTTQVMDGLYELRAICSVDPLVLDDFMTEAPVNADSESSGGGGCFIATAAYGSPMAPQIQILRDFRDTYMMPNAVGHWLVEQYYRWSPPVADFIRSQDWLRAAVRIGLTPIVWSVQGWMHGSRTLIGLVLFGILAVTGIGIVRVCRRDVA